LKVTVLPASALPKVYQVEVT